MKENFIIQDILGTWVFIKSPDVGGLLEPVPITFESNGQVYKAIRQYNDGLGRQIEYLSNATVTSSTKRVVVYSPLLNSQQEVSYEWAAEGYQTINITGTTLSGEQLNKFGRYLLRNAIKSDMVLYPVFKDGEKIAASELNIIDQTIVINNTEYQQHHFKNDTILHAKELNEMQTGISKYNKHFQSTNFKIGDLLDARHLNNIATGATGAIDGDPLKGKWTFYTAPCVNGTIDGPAPLAPKSYQVDFTSNQRSFNALTTDEHFKPQKSTVKAVKSAAPRPMLMSAAPKTTNDSLFFVDSNGVSTAAWTSQGWNPEYLSIEISSIDTQTDHESLASFLQTNAVHNVDTIYFKIAGGIYIAEVGMTWEQWVNSIYNINQRFIITEDNRIRTKIATHPGAGYVETDIASIQKDDLPIAYYEYRVSTHSGGTN